MHGDRAGRGGGREDARRRGQAEARGKCQHGEAESDFGGDAASEPAGGAAGGGAGGQAGAVNGGERQHRGDGDELQREETAVGGVDERRGAAELDGGEDGAAQHEQADEGEREPREAAERGCEAGAAGGGPAGDRRQGAEPEDEACAVQRHRRGGQPARRGGDRMAGDGE
jgi:hypothetical protein